MNTLTKDEEPDIFDLSDWLYTHRREVYDAIKYLHATTFYAAALKVWKDAGEPVLFHKGVI